MEGLAYIHLAMAFEEANSDSFAKDIKPFNKFTWKLPSLAWIHLISWIMAISVLNATNSSLAFPAQIITNTSGSVYPDDKKVITLYVSQNNQGQPIFQEHNNGKYEFIKGSKIDVLFCRIQDNWCYVTREYNANPSSFERAWIKAEYICMLIQNKHNCLKYKFKLREDVFNNEVDQAYSQAGTQPLEPYAQAEKLNQWTYRDDYNTPDEDI